MLHWLFLDDVRDPLDASVYMRARIGEYAGIYAKEDWTIVRSYDEFVKHIEENGMPTLISFDHDLAHEHYDPRMYTEDYPETFKEKTGYDCAKWLVDYCIDNRIEPPKFEVHSMNPVGTQRISSLLHGFTASKAWK
jgi:hypothetical protein